MTERKPNVLLIVVDACRFDYLRGSKAETPSADVLAAEGTDFRRAISPAPWTLPSVTSLLTGRYPHEHGANSRSFDLKRGRTVTADLREAGYRCVHLSPKTWIGDWLPQGWGFHRVEEFTGPEHRHFEGGADVRRLSAGVARGPEWYATVVRRALQSENPALSLANAAMYRYREAKGDAWLDDVRAGERAASIAADLFAEFADRDDPFFAYVHLMDPHLPFYVPEEFRSPVRPPGCETYEAEREYLQRLMDDLWAIRLGERRLSDAELRFLRRRYADEVQYADRIVGRILDSLSKRGLDDDTLVVLTADHGEHLGEGEDRTLLDHQTSVGLPLVRVPLVVRHPDQFDSDSRDDEFERAADEPGRAADELARTSDDLVQTNYVAETVRALAGVEHDLARSLLPEDGKARRETALAEYAGVVRSHPPEEVRDDRLFRSRRTAIAGEWKLDDVGGEYRARRIQWDENEAVPVALDDVPPDVRGTLTRLLDDRRTADADATDRSDWSDRADEGGGADRERTDESDRAVPEDVESNLRDLGYLR